MYVKAILTETQATGARLAMILSHRAQKKETDPQYIVNVVMMTIMKIIVITC